MSKAQERKQHEDLEQHKLAVLNALIGEQVIDTLGEPDGLHTVQVRRLWEDHYRVNILIGPDAVSVKIANSYFVEANGNGTIVDSSPKITKQY